MPPLLKAMKRQNRQEPQSYSRNGVATAFFPCRPEGRHFSREDNKAYPLPFSALAATHSGCGLTFCRSRIAIAAAIGAGAEIQRRLDNGDYRQLFQIR